MNKFIILGLIFILSIVGVSANVWVVPVDAPEMNVTLLTTGTGTRIPENITVYFQCFASNGAMYYLGCTSLATTEFNITTNSTHGYIRVALNKTLPTGYNGFNCRYDTIPMGDFKWSRTSNTSSYGHRGWLRTYASYTLAVTVMNNDSINNLNVTADGNYKSVRMGHPTLSWVQDFTSLNLSPEFDLNSSKPCIYINGTGNTFNDVRNAIVLGNITKQAFFSYNSLIFFGGFVGTGNITFETVSVTMVGGMGTLAGTTYNNSNMVLEGYGLWYNSDGKFYSTKLISNTVSVVTEDNVDVTINYDVGRSLVSYLNKGGYSITGNGVKNIVFFNVVRYFNTSANTDRVWNMNFYNNAHLRPTPAGTPGNRTYYLFMENISFYNYGYGNYFDIGYEYNLAYIPYNSRANFSVSCVDCYSNSPDKLPLVNYSGVASVNWALHPNISFDTTFYYNSKIKFIDIYGNLLSNVSINVSDVAGTQYSALSDVNGSSTLNMLFWNFKLNQSTSSRYTQPIYYGNFTFNISKSGYLSKSFTYNPSSGFDWVLELEPDNWCPFTFSKIYITGNSSDSILFV